MPRPTVVGTPTFAPLPNAPSGGDTRTLTTPAGAAIGETLLAVLTCQSQSAVDVGLPSGWDRIGLPVTDSNAVRVLGYFRHYLTATPAASYDFTNPVPGARFGGMMVRIANADPSQPIAYSPAYGALSSRTVQVPASYCPTVEALYLIAGAAQHGATVPTTIETAPAGMTAVQSMEMGLDGAAHTSLHLWRADVDIGVVGVNSFVWAFAPTQSAANGVVVRGLGTVPPPVPHRVHIVGAPTITPGPNTTATASNLVMTTPAGAAKGESLLAVLTSQTQTASDVGLPAGWTRIGLAAINSATVRVLGFFIHHLDPADPTPVPTSYLFTSPAASSRFGGMMVRLRNAYATQPMIAASGYGTLSGTSISIPSVSVGADEGLYLAAAAVNVTSGVTAAVSVPPVGMTQVGEMIAGLNTGSRTGLWLWQQDVESGVEGAKAVGMAQAPSTGTTNMLVIGRGTPPDTPGWLCKQTTGPTTWRDVELHYYDGFAKRPVMNAVSLPAPQSRRVTIADMEAEAEFFWAHRGGSFNWVEMTVRAYTNAVFHGTKCLEISLQRSLDGVYVMSHDESTLRMTGVDIIIPDAQWDLLKALNVSSHGLPAEKLGRFEEYLETYGQSHVSIVEDKTYVLANLNALVALIESYYGRTDAVARFIFKFYGLTSSTYIDAVASLGYKTWGYFYNDEAVTNMPTKASMFTYLGLNHDATPANWAAAMSYGKRVVAHIPTAASHVVSARAKGATGFQCGNVLDCVPKLNTLPG